MAGTLITVIPKTDYTFTPVGTTVSETIIARALNVVPYREGVLIARVHGKSSSVGTQTLSVIVRQVAPSADDPSAEFVVTGSNIASVSFNCGSATTAPLTAFGSFTAPFAPFVRVLLQTQQGTQNTTFTASVSVDLVLRE